MAVYQHQSFDMDTRLQLPSHFIFVGGTNSGKTTLFLNTLKHMDKMYHPKPSKILLLYQEYQDCYLSTQNELTKNGVEFECIKATDVNIDDISAMCKDISGQIMVVYDDCTESSSSSANVADMVMRGRHKNISVVLLWHTLFPKGSKARIISLNTTYFFLLSSLRIRGQVKCLADQTGIKHIHSAFEDVMKKKNYAYLLLDLHNRTPDFARLRSNILPNEIPHYVYAPSV